MPRNPLRRLSIKSQLLTLLLAIALSGMFLIAVVAYQSGKTQLTEASFNQLISLRGAKSNRLQGYMGRVLGHAKTLGEDGMVLQAMQAFSEAFQKLSTQPVTPEMLAALRGFYAREVLPRMTANTDGRPELDTYLPDCPEAIYLQFHYVIRNGIEPETAVPGPGFAETAYSELHARMHPLLKRLTTTMRYQDLLLISPEGDVVYSAAKNLDLGTSLKSGPYSETALARAFATTRQSKDPGHVDFTDFTHYPPTHHAPAAFVTVPMLDGAKLAGVLAIQIDIDEIDFVMSGNRQWAAEGLGKSGEVYLVGADLLMRSNSRFLLDDKERYLAQIVENGVSPSIADRIRRLDTSVLLQPVHTEAARTAVLAHRSGILDYTDYRGIRVLGAYQPIEVAGTPWGLVAKMDYAEAFAPVATFERRVMFYSAAFVVAVTLLALWLTARFVRPLNLLAAAMREAGEGHLEVRVDDSAGDEIGLLSRAFNQMLEKQRESNEALRQKNRENESLLLNILPAPIAERVKSGEQQIADSVASLTVLFSDLLGFDDFSRETPVEAVVSLLNEIVGAFDDAAERHGVEKVRTFGSVYMAVSGLSIPRIDHAHRMISFARELQDIIQRVNQRHGLHLALSIGINSGPAIAGIVGREKFIYDLWGDTVSLAGRMQHSSEGGGIRVTQAVKNALDEDYSFRPDRMLELPGPVPHPVWTLTAP